MTSERGRAAFIMAHNRQELLNEAVNAIRPQVDQVLVIDNASDPRLKVDGDVALMYIPDQPPNLAQWWNVGLDFYMWQYGDAPHDVAVLCDDSIVPEGWFKAVTDAMRESGATAGSTSPWNMPHPPVFKDQPDYDIMHRMCSWAFVVDGTRKVRADESMHWWWFDTDFDITCRRNGGTIQISGWSVANQQPNHYTNLKPELGEQAGRDRQTFAAKHEQDFPYTGGVPW